MPWRSPVLLIGDPAVLLRRGQSGRALARAALGREFPTSALSIAERGPRPTIAHVSSRPPSNSVRWVFPSTASSSGTTQFGLEPSAVSLRAYVRSLTSLRTVMRLLQPSRRAFTYQAPRLARQADVGTKGRHRQRGQHTHRRHCQVIAKNGTFVQKIEDHRRFGAFMSPCIFALPRSSVFLKGKASERIFH